MKDKNCHLISLSEELKYHVASFLSGIDALHLMETCTTLYQDLPLSSLSPPYALTPTSIQEWSGDADIPRKGPQIPILYTQRVHSITLTSRPWVGGEIPAHIYVVACHGEPTTSTSDENHFVSERVVATAIITCGEVSRLTIAFRPQPFTNYFLWYRGNVVQTTRIMVHTVIFDSPNRSLAKEYRRSCNPISPLRSMFAHVMWQALQARG